MSVTVKAFIKKDKAGAWLLLPASGDDFQKVIQEIGASDANDITISKYETDLTVFPSDILMNADLDYVNYLAARLAAMDGKKLDALDAVMHSSFRFTTLEQLIDYTYNTDYFLFRPGIKDAAELGRHYVYDTGLCQMPEGWEGGIDLERFGAHAAKKERGEFTPVGYLMPSGDEWQSIIAECGIPDEYCLFGRHK